jgi:hypothetical protein
MVIISIMTITTASASAITASFLEGVGLDHGVVFGGGVFFLGISLL